MKITQQYLHQIELFVIKKLLLEAGRKPKKYLPTDFNKHGSKVIIDWLLYLSEEKLLTISGIKIGRDFFISILSNSDFIDFVNVDVDERGKPAYAAINYKAIKDWISIGLGKGAFKRYEEECCPEGNILEPDLDLKINAKELKHITENSSHFPGLYVNALSKNLIFSICQSGKQKKKLAERLNKYLEKFRNDDLERQSATDYFKYARQKEIMYNTIEHFRKDYPIKNLWLNESDISAHCNAPTLENLNPSKNCNFLEMVLCLERDGKSKGIRIEELDKEKGIKITDYSINQTLIDEGDQKKQNIQINKKSEDTSKNNDITKVRTRVGSLVVNKSTGSVKLGNFSGDINPKSQEFKVLIKLISNKNYQATYEDLLDENTSTTNKRKLSFVVRNLKQVLGILPVKKAKNKNCIKNMKRYGYKLLIT